MKKLANLIVTLLCCTINACTGNKQQSSTQVVNNGVRIAYTDTGRGDTTLLFVHGWAINKTYFTNQVNFFKKHYRVVTMDLGGYGQSGKNRNDFNVNTFAGDVDAIIKQLDLKNVVLIGHSMAGDIVLESAVHNPKKVIAVVGIDNFKNPGVAPKDSVKSMTQYKQVMAQMKHNFKSVSYPYINQYLFYKTTPQAVRNKVMYDVAHVDTVVAVKSMEQDNFHEADKLKQAGKPLYIISSDVTPTDTSALHARGVPVQLTYIHAVGHFPMVEKPAEFNAVLQQMLSQFK